jgi:Icc-related predicted phosphoesterase
MKENRAATNMDSIIRGLRINQNIFLFRHPCGCVASVLNGIKSGKMTPSLVSDRKKRFKDIRQNDYIVSSNITEKAFLEMPEYEYQALLWRIQNDDYINLSQQFTKSVFVNYENFLIDTGENTKKLFHILGMSYSDSVNSFLHESSASDAKQLTVIKDSKSHFYSVYRGSEFNPEKWKKDLTEDQIKSIERHSLDTYEKMLSFDICKNKI